MKRTLNEVAKAYSLEQITTTPDFNGYPRDLKPALIGFQSFEDAERAANEIGGHPVELVRPDGHEFWTRKGHVFKAFDYSDAQTLFGDNYETFTNSGDYWEFMREALPELISRREDPEDAEKLIKQVKETAEAIDDLEDGETALCENIGGVYAFFIILRPMEYYHDGAGHAIGIEQD